ncbi:MAG: dual specificity protein phosphatase family protein [Anaerolineae bacterium]|nr:dual specificity protein phosphatase family protein [Anaerolineae bacterium]
MERKSPLRDLWKQFTSLWYSVTRSDPITSLKGILELGYRTLTGAPPPWFSKVTPNLYVSGQYNARGLPRLRRRGVTAVVNMRDEYDDKAAGIAPEHYLNLKVVDNTAPEMDQLRNGIKFIQERLDEGGKVYIHCAAGVGRAPTMAAAYLLSQGMTPNQAWARLQKVRPFIRPVPAQIEQIELLAKELAETREKSLAKPKPTADPVILKPTPSAAAVEIPPLPSAPVDLLTDDPQQSDHNAE